MDVVDDDDDDDVGVDREPDLGVSDPFFSELSLELVRGLSGTFQV